MNKLLTLVTLITMMAIGNKALAKTSPLTEPREVQTSSEYKPHVGILYGLMIPEGSYQNDDLLGIDIGFQPLIPFGLGVEYTLTNVESDAGGSFYRNDLLAKVSYNFGGDMNLLKYSYVALGLGASFNDYSTDFVAAPIVGFDVPLSRDMEHISLGASAKYSFYEGSQPDSLSLTAAVKFWF